MDRSQFSVSWEAHQKSICNGLSALQQRGEYVDMTLAADGHHVKVHRMVMSLVSPYIKELIATADCPHPVIFLNQMSYKTLCNILEYVYTGEVLVPKDSIDEFIAAGKALHIRGLLNMHLTSCVPKEASFIQIHNKDTNTTTITDGKEIITKTIIRKRELKEIEPTLRAAKELQQEKIHEVFIDENEAVDTTMDSTFDDILDDDDIEFEEPQTTATSQEEQEPLEKRKKSPEAQQSMPELDSTPEPAENPKDPSKTPHIQYSVSNQGNLQMVLNRYLYYLVYTGKTSGHRRWQCIDSHMKKFKCPAAVISKNGMIVQRISAHNHPFHDEKIIKKEQTGIIYSGLKQAQIIGRAMVEERNARISTPSQVKNNNSKNK